MKEEEEEILGLSMLFERRGKVKETYHTEMMAFSFWV